VEILAGVLRMNGCPKVKIRYPNMTKGKLALTKQTKNIPIR
jgi:hypothetical protein